MGEPAHLIPTDRGVVDHAGHTAEVVLARHQPVDQLDVRGQPGPELEEVQLGLGVCVVEDLEV